jgi:hypothetical protein
MGLIANGGQRARTGRDTLSLGQEKGERIPIFAYVMIKEHGTLGAVR